MAITREKNRRFLAVAEYIEPENTSLLTIFDLKSSSGYKRLRELKLSELGIKYSTLAFSRDSKLISGISSGFGVIWDWYKEKIIGKKDLNADITRISINPKDSHLVSTSGPNHWRTWRIEEKSFKEQPLISKLAQTQNFTDHDWIDDDTAVAVTDMSEIFISRDNQIIKYFEFGFGNLTGSNLANASITCILGFSRGFIITSDEGHLAIYEHTETNDFEEQVTSEQYSFLKTWHSGKKQSIVALALMNSEEKLGIALKSNDICICSLSQAMSPDGCKFEVFCGGFHSGRIKEMDLATQRTLLATCSDVDHTLRIWNYNTMTCELAKKLYIVQSDAIDTSQVSDIKPLLSVAFHPSGYYLAISFVDKVRLFHLLLDELRLFRDVSTPSSNLLKFSQGGHFLAIASGKSIFIYKAYTLQLVTILQDHASPVQDMGWANNDSKLVSMDSDGQIFQFTSVDFKGRGNVPNKRVNYKSMTLAGECYVVHGVEGPLNVLNEITPEGSDGPDGRKELVKAYTVERKLSQVCFFQSNHHQPVYIASTDDGSVVNYGSSLSNTWLEEISAHQGTVTRLRASPDGKFVFSGGEDGSIFLFKVEEPIDVLHAIPEGKEKEVVNKAAEDSLADIVLIEREKLEKFKAEVEKKHQELEEMNHKLNHSTKLRESRHQASLQELKESLNENIRAKKIRISELTAQKEKQEKDYEKQLRLLETERMADVDNLEKDYERKLGIEDERYRQLEHDKVEMKQYYEDQLKSLKVHNETTIESLEKAFKDALWKAQEEYESTKKTSDELTSVYERRLLQQEDEHEIEVMDLKEKYEKQLLELRELGEKLKNTNKGLLTSQSKADSEKIREKRTIEDSHKRIEEKQEKIKDLNKNIKNLELSIKIKEDMLIKKQIKIDEYKHEIKNLDQQKKNLTDRKREILDELQPKDNEIDILENRLKSVKADLLKERKDNEELERNMKRMDELIKHLKNDNKIKEENILKIDKIIRNIINDIHYGSSLGYKQKINEMKSLYQSYVIDDGKLQRKDADSIEEIENQIRYKEKSITGLHNKQLKAMKTFKVDLRKRTQENSTLIQELNKLRLEKKNDEIRIRMLGQELEKLERQFEELKKNNKSKVTSSVHPVTPGKLKTDSQTPFMNYLSKPSAIDSRLTSLQDRQRIIDLQNELEEKKEQNFYLRMEIDQLKELARQRKLM
jgi:WD40 repeat protein